MAPAAAVVVALVVAAAVAPAAAVVVALVVAAAAAPAAAAKSHTFPLRPFNSHPVIGGR
ncbi:hypothetical protein BN1232_03656 [Mycobacterium lentiflavum]|uniref:Secreted peptide n=1 Tax=Mycobacterium lentiflavum TaxID=141349 RepID=A0A0E3WCW6_MYCLN|nr:hypothetical protein BN1232_03656 [Mycobacterium lentiflavum]